MVSWAVRVYLASLVLILAAACGGVTASGGDGDGDGDAATDAPAGDGDGGGDAAIDGPGVTHTVFTTSTVMPPSIGLDAFTAACQDLAAEAGLDGNFVPLIELDNDPIVARLNIQGPVFNTNEEMVATGIEEFQSGQFLATNGFNQSGGPPGDTIVWIGDQNNNTCQNWSTSNDILDAGQGDAASTTFLGSNSNINCATQIQRSIMCISQ